MSFERTSYIDTTRFWKHFPEYRVELTKSGLHNCAVFHHPNGNFKLCTGTLFDLDLLNEVAKFFVAYEAEIEQRLEKLRKAAEQSVKLAKSKQSKK